MAQDDRRKVGTEMGGRIWGRSRFSRMEASGKEMSEAFWDFSLDAWALFARPQLDPRMRSLCMVAGLTAMGRDDELRMHIFGALNNGASQDEVIEAIIQMVPYAGIPRCRGAILTARSCFADYQPPADR